MSFKKNTSRVFASKISENYFIKEKQELKILGFDDISIFKILENGKIDYHFSNERWGKLYIEKEFFSIDPSVDAFHKIDATLIPWVAFSKNNPVMKSRKDLCLLTNGLSIFEKERKEGSLIINLGSSNEETPTKIMDSKESLSWLLYLKEKISQKLF